MTYNRYIIICLFLVAGCGAKILASNDAKGKLLMDVAETCVSGNHEPTDCQLMRQGAELFGIPELATLTEMRENRVLDEGYRQELVVTTALLEYANQHYGKGSFEAINCRRRAVGIYSNVNWEKAATLAEENETYAIALSKKHPKDRDFTVLKAVVQLERLVIQRSRDEDNPEHWMTLFLIEKELEPFFKGEIKYTPELVDICQYITNLKSYDTTYPVYVNSLIKTVFPDGLYIEGRVYNNDVLSNIEAFAQHAVNGSKTLWRDNDLRRIAIELDWLSVRMRYVLDDFETIHDRIKEIHLYLKSYLPDNDPSAIQAELLKWDCDIIYRQNLYEVRDPYPIQLKLREFFGADSEIYLNNLYRLMNQQIQVNLIRAQSVAQEIMPLAENIFSNETDSYGRYLLGMYMMKQAEAQENPSIFQKYIATLSDFYRQHHHPTWESIYIGRYIASIYSTYLLLPDNAIEFEKIALDDMTKLISKESILYGSCLDELINYQINSGNREMQKEAMSNCEELLKLYEKSGQFNGQTYRNMSDLQSILGMREDAVETLRTGISKCTREEDGMWRCLMQLILGWEIYSNINEGERSEAEQLFGEAIPFFMEHRQKISGTYLEGYHFISQYYGVIQQYDKAEEILKLGMEHHDAIYKDFDYIYSQLLTDLYSLYANVLNDMDKAEQLLEGKIEAIRENPSFSLHMTILDLLWDRYYLIKRKNHENWMLRQEVFSEIIKEITLMATMAGEKDAQQLKHIVIPFLYEWSTLFPQIDYYKRQARQESPDEWERQEQVAEAMLNQIKEMDIISGLNNLEEYVKSQTNNYLDDTRIIYIYGAFANYYIGLENDTVKAEYFYKKLMESHDSGIRYRGASELADLKVLQGQYEQAVQLYKEIESIADENPYVMNGAEDFASFNYNLGQAYYMNGQYHEAIKPARDYYKCRQQLIAQNFDLLTQSEREAFVKSGGGAGSEPICALLSKYPHEMSEDAYDALLSEKGLQLRASERIKKGILKSGDKVLIALQDSLNVLSAQFKKINTTLDWEHGNYNYDPKTVEIRQKIEALERNINRQAAQFIEGMDTPDWKKLQSVLQPGEAAVEYVFSDSIVGVLVLLPNGDPQYIQMTSAPVLWKGLDTIKDFEIKRRSEVLYEEDRLHLFERLWQPMESLMKDVRTVYYSPSGFLNDLAFAAFKCPDGTYLSDHYELHQMLSTGDLVSLREKPTANPVMTAMLFGSVYYSPEQEQLARQIAQGTGIRGQASEQRGAILDDGEAFGYLSFTKEEVEHVDHILKDKGIAVQQLTGFSPTEETLHAVSEKSPEVLHLSTHGFFVRGDKEAKENKFLSRFPSMQFSSMQRSGLALVGANRTWEGATDKPEEADGIITANEVALLDLSHTRLAVLSACQTAVGQYSMEGVYGMHRGFKQAGVRSILASLWNVNDKSTARLMELFYGKWLSGTPMQESLNEAIRELRKDYPSPFYWAPFVLMDAEN